MEVYVPITVPEQFTPRRYSLASVVNWITPGDPHWAGGVQYDADCAEVDVTVAPCISGAPTIASKTVTWAHDTRGSRAFDIFDRVDCSPGGSDWWEVAQSKALRALSQSGPTQLERTFWTGDSGNPPVLVYPNLTSTGPVYDQGGSGTTGVLLQPAGMMISGTGLDVVEGLGRLEEAFGDCYDGEGVVHIPLVLLAALASEGLCYRDGNVLRTYAGNAIVVGAGYDDTVGPGGTTPPAGTAWMFMTSPIFGVRGTPRVRNNTDSFARGTNSLQMIAEQKFLLGWTCCLNGVLVTTGGQPAGTASAST